MVRVRAAVLPALPNPCVPRLSGRQSCCTVSKLIALLLCRLGARTRFCPYNSFADSICASAARDMSSRAEIKSRTSTHNVQVRMCVGIYPLGVVGAWLRRPLASMWHTGSLGSIKLLAGSSNPTLTRACPGIEAIHQPCTAAMRQFNGHCHYCCLKPQPVCNSVSTSSEKC